MPLLPDEPTVECPYNPAHKILPARMQFHLVRCRRANPNKDKFTVCSYNSIHHIPIREKAYHESICPDRVTLELYANQEEFASADPAFGKFGYANPTPALPEGDDYEDWEAEATVTKSYDPMKKCRSQKILIQPKGMTKTQRRAFRAFERERHRRLEEGIPLDDEDDSKAEEKTPEVDLVPIEEEQALRRPKVFVGSDFSQAFLAKKMEEKRKEAMQKHQKMADESSNDFVQIDDDRSERSVGSAMTGSTLIGRGRACTFRTLISGDRRPGSLNESSTTIQSSLPPMGRGRGRGGAGPAWLNTKLGLMAQARMAAADQTESEVTGPSSAATDVGTLSLDRMNLSCGSSDTEE